MFGFRANLLYLILALVCLGLFSGNGRDRQIKADFIGRTAFLPFMSSVNAYRNMLDVQERNRALRIENTRLMLRTARLENRLRLLDADAAILRDSLPSFIKAGVIGYTGNVRERNLVIDKGRLHGLRQDMPVLSASGVVGKVVMAAVNYSIVLPLGHPGLRVGVMDKRSLTQGLLESDVQGTVYMNLIQSTSNVALGDTIVTSNISTVFPRGYPVGVIKQITQTPGDLSKRIVIEPFAEAYNQEQVIVLTGKRRENIPAEIKVDH